MSKEIIERKQQKVNDSNNNLIHDIIEVRNVSSGFCRMPDIIFSLASERNIGKWKARFIVGFCYLYSLTFNKEKATTTSKELMKVMGTNSFDTLYNFKEEVYWLQKQLKEEAVKAGMVLDLPDDPVMSEVGRKGKTIFYLVDQSMLIETFKAYNKHSGTFSFFNLSLLLPVSVQAKASLLYLCRKARGGSLLTGTAESEISIRELSKVLSII